MQCLLFLHFAGRREEIEYCGNMDERKRKRAKVTILRKVRRVSGMFCRFIYNGMTSCSMDRKKKEANSIKARLSR